MKSGATLKIDSVSHQYSGSGLVLDRISFNLAPGEFVSLLGPSGCGKSTLLRLIAQLEAPSQGSVQNDVSEATSFVFQEPTLLPWRTALANVVLPLELLGDTNAQFERAQTALKSMQLGDAALKYPQELSGGMKMRVSVARALVTEPQLLLFDEPFAALDESTRHSLQRDLRSLWRGRRPTIIFVTHSISEAVFLSNRIMIMGARPGVIRSEALVDLPDNRDEKLRLSVEFLKEVQKVSALMVGGSL